MYLRKFGLLVMVVFVITDYGYTAEEDVFFEQIGEGLGSSTIKLLCAQSTFLSCASIKGEQCVSQISPVKENCLSKLRDSAPVFSDDFENMSQFHEIYSDEIIKYSDEIFNCIIDETAKKNNLDQVSLINCINN